MSDVFIICIVGSVHEKDVRPNVGVETITNRWFVHSEVQCILLV